MYFIADGTDAVLVRYFPEWGCGGHEIITGRMPSAKHVYDMRLVGKAKKSIAFLGQKEGMGQFEVDGVLRTVMCITGGLDFSLKSCGCPEPGTQFDLTPPPTMTGVPTKPSRPTTAPTAVEAAVVVGSNPPAGRVAELLVSAAARLIQPFVWMVQMAGREAMVIAPGKTLDQVLRQRAEELARCTA